MIFFIFKNHLKKYGKYVITMMKQFGLTIITHNINIHIGASGPCKGGLEKGAGGREKEGGKGGDCC